MIRTIKMGAALVLIKALEVGLCAVANVLCPPQHRSCTTCEHDVDCTARIKIKDVSRSKYRWVPTDPTGRCQEWKPK